MTVREDPSHSPQTILQCRQNNVELMVSYKYGCHFFSHNESQTFKVLHENQWKNDEKFPLIRF